MCASVATSSDPAAVARLFDDVQADARRSRRARQQRGHRRTDRAVRDVALADWERTLAVNLTASSCARSARSRCCKASANASIANLSSAAGRFGFPNRAPYCGFQVGRDRLTKSLSMELGAFGIRVNAICPGPVAASASSACSRARPRCATSHPTSCATRCLGNTSLRRLVSADDIANAIVFLASRAAPTSPATRCRWMRTRRRWPRAATPPCPSTTWWPSSRGRGPCPCAVGARGAEARRCRRRSDRPPRQAGSRCRSRTSAMP